jgi:predicted Zn finger-like uncharacterized protein
MDIHFSCPNCGQSIVVDEAGAGMEVPCPNCQQTLVVPAPEPEPVVLLTQLCPKCERAWPAEKRVCDHCGTELHVQPAP